MFAQITSLQYWKSEHDEAACEDACGYDSLRGLFAVADGAGTTLFANLWAQILVEQFLAVPLISGDPFEVEWWVRRVQNQHKNNSMRLPALATMQWNASQKIQKEGSQSTLITMRLARTDATSADAELLAFGDSCAFVHKSATKYITSFPLVKEAEFDRAPICLPSRLAIFNRYFHRCQSWRIRLAPGDTVLLASDAVSRWLISSGEGNYASPYHAFRELSTQTPLNWPQFVLEHRNKRSMIDDDCTALVIKLYSQPRQDGHYELLDSTFAHDPHIRQERKRDFELEIQHLNKELAAILYGDGVDLVLEGVNFSQKDLQAARQVADAMREVLASLRLTLNSPDLVSSMRPVWQKYAALLGIEPCASRLRETLTQLGVIEPQVVVDDTIETPIPSSAVPVSPTPQIEEAAPEGVMQNDDADMPETGFHDDATVPVEQMEPDLSQSAWWRY